MEFKVFISLLARVCSLSKLNFVSCVLISEASFVEHLNIGSLCFVNLDFFIPPKTFI